MTDPGPTHESGRDEDAVGYGRPPKHSRFKPGQSGNPAGRPRRKRNMETLLVEVMAQKVAVTRNGRTKRVPADTAILLRLLEKALGGDMQASRLLLALRAAHVRDSDANETNPASLLFEEDLAILAQAGLLPRGEGGDVGA
jgi:hypothetical protein